MARYKISQSYLIEINHRVQMINDIAEFRTKEFFRHLTIITVSNITVSVIKTSLATTNARSAIM